MKNPIYQTVIVGGGFTGLFTALHLAHEHYPRSVILIDQNERFCFKPLLYEYFSGEMDAMHVVPRFEELLHGSGVIFVQDTVQSIDLLTRQVKLTSGDCYNYSNLVLGLGSVTGFFGVEGAKEPLGRLPSYSTIRRTLLHLDYEQYSACLAHFFQVQPQAGETLAKIGKVLKGSYHAR